MKDMGKLPSFSCETEEGVQISFYQTSRAIGVCPPEFVFEVRGPGQGGQDEFVGRIRIEVCAHGSMEDFRRWLVLRAEHGKPLELIKRHSAFRDSNASFYPPERVPFEVRVDSANDDDFRVVLPSRALKEVRLEMIQTKPPGELDF